MLHHYQRWVKETKESTRVNAETRRRASDLSKEREDYWFNREEQPFFFGHLLYCEWQDGDPRYGSNQQYELGVDH